MSLRLTIGVFVVLCPNAEKVLRSLIIGFAFNCLRSHCVVLVALSFIVKCTIVVCVWNFYYIYYASA